MKIPANCTRISDTQIRVNSNIPATIFANSEVPVQDAAVEELTELLSLQDTALRMHEVQPELFKGPPSVEKVSLSPDFHKGAGIPIGTSLLTKNFVVPQAVGSDINCGVRLHATSLTYEQVRSKVDALEPQLRHIFFEGGRSIPLTQIQRQQLLTRGLYGLLECYTPERETWNQGIWQGFDLDQQYKDLERTKHLGCLDTKERIWGLDDYVGRTDVTRDSQIGSIGGGNHFVELQYVSKIFKGDAAYAWNLKVGSVVAMVHSGSVNIGHLCGSAYLEVVRKVYPQKLTFPKNGIFPLPNNCSPAYDTFFTALHNAGNFAFANRLFLALMMRQALRQIFEDFSYDLVYDSPHNLVWDRGESRILHRKGACPAGGIGEGCDPYFGEVVLVPGSMGSASFVMEGCGNVDALGTASHGAGRNLSRGDALHHNEEEFQKFLKEFRIITPIDPKRPDIRVRPEIVKKYLEAIKKEAPFAYKDIGPVVRTLQDAGVATPVAELKPILTLKGL